MNKLRMDDTTDFSRWVEANTRWELAPNTGSNPFEVLRFRREEEPNSGAYAYIFFYRRASGPWITAPKGEAKDLAAKYLALKG